MTPLVKAVRDYLTLRRGLGFKLVKHEAGLEKFASFLERKRGTHITSELALEWATLPAHHQPCQWTARLTIVRGFARYWSALDPVTEVPPGYASVVLQNGSDLNRVKQKWVMMFP